MPRVITPEESAAATILAKKGGRKRGVTKKRDDYHYSVVMPQARAREAALRRIREAA